MKLFNIFGKKEQSLEDTAKELAELSEEERDKKLESVTENKEELLDAIADILNDGEGDDDNESLIDTLKGKFTVEELKKIISEIELEEGVEEVDINELKEEELAEFIVANKPEGEIAELLGIGGDEDGSEETSVDMSIKNAIAAIKEINDGAEITDFVHGEERKKVLKAADRRVNEINDQDEGDSEDERTNEGIEDAEQKKERYDELIKRANKEWESGDANAAIASSVEAQDLGTGDNDGAELISEIRETQSEDYKACEEKCLELEEEGKFKEVVKAWAKFAESAPDTPWADKANARLAVVQGVINATTENKTAGRKPTPIGKEELKEDMQNLIIKLAQYTLQLRDDRKSGIATFNRAKRDLTKIVRITFR